MVRVARVCRFALVACAAAAADASAQEFPPKQMTIVVGFPAGGGTDFFARLFAPKLGAGLGSNVVVDNRPGAAGTIATGIVAKAPATGATLLCTPVNLAMTRALNDKLPFDPQRDLAPITILARIPFVLVVHPSLPVRNVHELLALAKKKPGALDYGSSGAGSPPHLAMELLKWKGSVDLNHVPYKGAGQITTALLSGEVQASFLIPPVAQTHIQSGRMRGLAVSTRARSTALPALPTIAEAGIPGYEVTQWHALLAPAKTPPAVIARIHAEVTKALGSPDVRQRFAAEGAEPGGGAPAELAAHLASEIRIYSELVQRLGLKPE